MQKKMQWRKPGDLLQDDDSEQALTFSTGQVMTAYCRIKLCLQETATHRATGVHNKSTPYFISL